MNNLKTAFLLIVLTVGLVVVGGMIGGQYGMLIALGIGLAMNGWAYWFSDRMVLRMYKASEVSEADSPELYNIVADLTQRASLPMPKIYHMPSPALNAFATGRNPKHAAVAVTDGLMQLMDRSELTAVLAHELSHVKHRDILIGTIAATVAGAVTMLGSMARWGAMFGGYSRDGQGGGGGNILVIIAVSMLAGVAATLVRMAVSRSREFEADAGAARLLGTPGPMISALRKLDAGAQRMPMDASPATAHMFIISPLSAGGRFSKMFSTHPPVEERIARLQKDSGMSGFSVQS